MFWFLCSLVVKRDKLCMMCSSSPIMCISEGMMVKLLTWGQSGCPLHLLTLLHL